jgi:hypothetical protein
MSGWKERGYQVDRRALVLVAMIGYAVAGLTFDILGMTWTALASAVYGYGGFGIVVALSYLTRNMKFQEMEDWWE